MEKIPQASRQLRPRYSTVSKKPNKNKNKKGKERKGKERKEQKADTTKHTQVVVSACNGLYISNYTVHFKLSLQTI